MSTPLSSFPFFPMAAFELINGHGNSKSEGVPSLKEMSNQWNRIEVVFSNTDRLRRVGFMVDDAESTRSYPPWTSFPVLSIRCYLSYFVTNV
jgi:hypothetical protein